MTKETVNHPDHYGGESNPYEVIKVIRAWGLDNNYALGNTVKYIGRAGKKDPAKTLEDLRKAKWYLDWEINKLSETKQPEQPTVEQERAGFEDYLNIGVFARLLDIDVEQLRAALSAPPDTVGEHVRKLVTDSPEAEDRRVPRQESFMPEQTWGEPVTSLSSKPIPPRF